MKQYYQMHKGVCNHHKGVVKHHHTSQVGKGLVKVGPPINFYAEKVSALQKLPQPKKKDKTFKLKF